MEIKERIDRVIARRKEQIPYLNECLESVQGILDSITQIDNMRETLLNGPEKYGVDQEVRDNVQTIQTNDLRNAVTLLIRRYRKVIDRFSRDQVNLAVIGKARQGKSLLLQTISGLGNDVIPAFPTGHCTGTRSVIFNVPNNSFKATIHFYSPVDILNVLQAYFDELYGKDEVRLSRYEDLSKFTVEELRSKLAVGQEQQIFAHLKAYIEHYEEWSCLIDKEKIVLTEPNEIQQYVAQHNGYDEYDPMRQTYYKYLAVKEAVIECEFPNSDVGKLVLRDTIGLGDTAVGIEESMIKTVGDESDAAVIIVKPDDDCGTLQDKDYLNLHKELREKFSDRHFEKWLFWVFNHDNREGKDNSTRCRVCKENEMKEFGLQSAGSFITDVSNKDEVYDCLFKLLDNLLSNIQYVDDGVILEVHKQAEIAYSEYRKVQSSLRSAFNAVLMKEVDSFDFLGERWGALYDSGMMKLLKDYKTDLKYKQSEDCVAFREAVNKILNDSIQLLPSVKSLEDSLQKGGMDNELYYLWGHELDSLRTRFSQQFLEIDNEVFEGQIREFREKIVSMLSSEKGGKLDKLLPVSDYPDKAEWLIQFAEQYFQNERYENFRLAFETIARIQISVRSFLMHRIQSCLDRLVNRNADDGKDNQLAKQTTEVQAMSIHFQLRERLGEVCEELRFKFGEDLFRDPNRILYSYLCEFYDRTNFSFANHKRTATEIWKSFYYSHMGIIWEDDLEEYKESSAFYHKWKNTMEQFCSYSQQDFDSVAIEGNGKE
ncbi:hypothetical protein [Ruminococcus albus]|uniref:hypothetical protein n=1 Tax=Ruminococcus albus TaxID=1264 RepID=UPI000465E210|nr:hypothetical protein [Ruminococcus albus]